MDKILGSTFEVNLGGKEYTVSFIKLKTISKATAYFKRKKISDFIALAKEAELPADIFAGELRTLNNENDTLDIEDFDSFDVGLHFLYLTLKDFSPDLSREDFENFPQKDIQDALDAIQPPLSEADKKKAEALEVLKVKKKNN